MKKIILGLLFLTILLSGCNDNSNLASKVSYVPVRVSQYKWSFLNDKGEVVCLDEFEHRPSMVYNEYFSCEEEDGYSLYQMKDGVKKKITALSGLMSVGYVEDGLVPATLKNHRIGVFAPSGDLKFEIKPVNGREIVMSSPGFADGMLRILADDYRIGFIDSNGNVAIDVNLYSATDFSEGLAVVRRRNDSESDEPYEIIDKTGKSIFRLRSGQSPKGSFNAGYLIVDDNDRDVLYDKDGEIYKFPSTVHRIHAVDKRFVIFTDDNGKYGITDIHGSILISPQYDRIDFVSSYMFLAKNDEEFVIIDNRGEIISHLDYSRLEGFGKFGFFACTSSGRYILIDEEDKQKGKEDFHDYDIESLCPTYCVYSNYSGESDELLDNFEYGYEVIDSTEVVSEDVISEATSYSSTGRTSIRHLAGYINGDYPVHMKLDLSANTGVYYYDKYGPSNCMSLHLYESAVSGEDSSFPLYMEEYNPNGQLCGTWDGTLNDNGFEGTGEFNGKTMSVRLFNCSPKESKL